MTLIVLEEAEKEFSKSAAYYESKEPGLGIRYRDEVAAVVDWILDHPEIPRLRPRGYRRVNLRCHRSLQNQPVGVESKPATLRR
jgi:plasmid stabilization system protein ParE